MMLVTVLTVRMVTALQASRAMGESNPKAAPATIVLFVPTLSTGVGA